MASGASCPYTFYPKKCDKIFPVFFTKFFHVLASTSGGKRCVRNGKYFPVFLYQNFSHFKFGYTFIPVSDSLFIPVSYTLSSYPRFRYPFYPFHLSPFPIHFLSPFLIPFYPRFRYPFSSYHRAPFPIPFPFLLPAFPEPFLPPPPMQPCTHVLRPVPNVRIGHKQQTIRMSRYSSPLLPLVSGHKSSCWSWSTCYPLTHANSIWVVIANKGAAMCTRMRACAHIITTYRLYGTGTWRC